jgi:putative toxin-antitoxin system antitoxin component (TIGR02293 family)
VILDSERLDRIMARTIEILGAEDKAARWLQTPNEALGGSSPLDRLATDLGTREVEALLGRIEHGVYS